MTSNVETEYEYHPLPEQFGSEILRVEVGSTLYGTGLPGHEDHDEMGIYVEGPKSTIGFGSKPHYVWRSAGDDTTRSQPHDTDLACYSLRKWMGLALNGNPSVLMVLFAPPDKVIRTTPLGDELRRHHSWFASKQAGKAFLGYMQQQRQRMTGERGRAGRVRIMPNGVVDWKYAMHMIRLGHQGYEFLTSGKVTLPMDSATANMLRAVRRGEVPFEDVILASESLENAVKTMLTSGPLPDKPMYETAEEFCVNAHLKMWGF